MGTLGRFRNTFLVALAAGLPAVFALFPWLPWHLKVLILLAVIVAAGLREYLQSVKPHLDFSKKRQFFFDLACERALERLREFDETARLNVMQIGWRLPRGKWGRFRPIYQLNMEGARDMHLKLRADQGAASEAVRAKARCVADLEAPDAPLFRLDEDQREKTKDLTLIFSQPIMRLKRADDGDFFPTDEVIGVVNIDSSRADARAFYEGTTVHGKDLSLREEVERAQEEMALVCSWILS